MNPQPNKEHQMLRSGITIYPSQNKAFSETLDQLIKKAPAHFALLVDVTGQVILAKGEQQNIEPVALGSLVAGDLAASQEIARLTGQYQDYQIILREGAKMHSFIVETGQHLVLFAQVTNNVPLGWARMTIKDAAHKLTEIVAQAPEEAETAAETSIETDQLPDLFDEALDDLWLE